MLQRWLARLLVRVRRGRRYTEATLAVAAGGPPWHRGLVAVATLVCALLVGLASALPLAAVVAPALAFFLVLADLEGPLRWRLAMLGWTALCVTVSGLLSIHFLLSPVWFSGIFAALTYLAGLLAWAGAPFLQATRFAVIVGLLLTNTPGIGALGFLELLWAAVLIAALARSIEAVLAPDHTRDDLASIRQAWFRLRAARPLLWRYALSYTLAAGSAWALGKQVDQVHPTWLAVSTLVVMWPDAVRSYQRILQRVFGTLLGALAALVLIGALPSQTILAAVALALVFFLPHFIRRNYWLHSALVVVFVLVALHVSSQGVLTTHAAIERIADVLLGCVFAMLGTLAAFGPFQWRAARALRDP